MGDDGVFILDKMFKVDVEKIKTIKPDAQILAIYHTVGSISADNIWKQLKKYGFKHGKDFIKENRIVLKREYLPLSRIAVHCSIIAHPDFDDERKKNEWRTDTVDNDDWYFKKKSFKLKPSQLAKEHIVVDKPRLQSVLKIVGSLHTSYKVVKEHPKLTKGKKLNRFVIGVGEETVTSFPYGVLTVKELAEKLATKKLIKDTELCFLIPVKKFKTSASLPKEICNVGVSEIGNQVCK